MKRRPCLAKSGKDSKQNFVMFLLNHYYPNIYPSAASIPPPPS